MGSVCVGGLGAMSMDHCFVSVHWLIKSAVHLRLIDEIGTQLFPPVLSVPMFPFSKLRLFCASAASNDGIKAVEPPFMKCDGYH